MNDMKNKKAEIIEIILITILISLSINLISSSIFALNEIKNIIIISIGIIICINVILYYLRIKVKSMNVDKIINGNIILNIKNKNIYKLLEYPSSFEISDNINAVMLEDKEINKKYKESLNNIEEDSKDIFKLQNSYFSFVINNALEYQILNLLTDHIYLEDRDTKTIDLDNAPKDILNNIFVRTLAKDYKKRDVFKNCEDEISEDSEPVLIKDDNGYIYNKLIITIPKDAVLIKKENSLIIKSNFFKLSIEWGIEDVSSPFSDMNFYNFFYNDNKIDYDDIEFSYYIKVKTEYTLLSMFSKKSNKYYLWIEFIVKQLIESFDFDECLKRNDWKLIKNLYKL